MDDVKNSSTFRTCASKYNVRSRIIKNLLDEYEYRQLFITRQEKETLVETNNQNQITRWDQERLDLNHSNQPNTDGELLTACHIRVLSNTYYDQLKSEYSIPMSTLEHYLAKICPPLQCRNAQHVHQMLKRGEVSRSKVLEIIKMSVPKSKVGRPTYLDSDEEALVVPLSEIEGDHGIPINVNTLPAELKLVIKAVNARQ